MPVINITLDPEKILTITTGEFGATAVRRLPNIPGNVNNGNSVISLNSSSEIVLGPFNETRRYVIDNDSDLTYSVSDYRLIYNKFATGIHTGGALSINGTNPATFDIAAGGGVIVDNYTDKDTPAVQKISWSAFTAQAPEFIASNFTSYVGIDRGGNIQQFTGVITPNNRRDYIILGLLVHTGGAVVESVSNFPSIGYDYPNIVVDFSDSVGLINRSGNVFGANGANLKLDKTLGEAFRIGGNFQNSTKNPSIVTSAALTAPALFKPYRDGSGAFTIDFPLTDAIDPSKYDDNSGTLVTVTPAFWSIIRIYLDPVNNNVIAHYGQNTYSSSDRALNRINFEDFTPNPVLRDALLRGFLVVRGGCTDLTDTAQALFLSADKFGQVPANSSTAPLTGGVLLAESTAKTSSFTGRWDKSYVIDNSSGAINVTLSAIRTSDVGAICEAWITSNPATYNVTFTAPDHTYSINAVSGINPDPAVATRSSATSAYLKVEIRAISTTQYLISAIDTVTV